MWRELIEVSYNADKCRLEVCIQVNVLGLCVMTREFIKQLRERGVDDGHVIFMNRYITGVPSFSI